MYIPSRGEGVALSRDSREGSRSRFYASMVFTTRAGLPTAMLKGGMSRVTTEPAPMTD